MVVTAIFELPRRARQVCPAFYLDQIVEYLKPRTEIIQKLWASRNGWFLCCDLACDGVDRSPGILPGKLDEAGVCWRKLRGASFVPISVVDCRAYHHEACPFLVRGNTSAWVVSLPSSKRLEKAG